MRKDESFLTMLIKKTKTISKRLQEIISLVESGLLQSKEWLDLDRPDICDLAEQARRQSNHKKPRRLKISKVNKRELNPYIIEILSARRS
jgi:tRNA splicing endonuclease